MAEPRVTPESAATADVVVAGAGIAGTGAALAAAGAGARVVVLDGGTGASHLGTGAIDVRPWRPGRPADDPIEAPVRSALGALDAYAIPDGGAAILTNAGVIRPARGRDHGILDARGLRGRVGVALCRRPGWDAAWLVAAWNDARAPFAREAAFEPLDAAIIRYQDEEAIPDADFAARHDDGARLGWLAERLREAMACAGGVFAAVVVPPMLGLSLSRSAELQRAVGVPVGEASAYPGGPAGRRFEAARDRAFAEAGVRRLAGRVSAIAVEDGTVRAACEDGRSFEASAVVLAVGGLLGGGLTYAPSEAALATELPREARPPLHLTVTAPVVLGAHGRPLEIPGTLFGYAPEAVSRPFVLDPLLERAGVLEDVSGAGEREPAGTRPLFAAGDVAADVPRTFLAALASGVEAGTRAARLAR
jgi:glycerol-3-phosphate dehydrogenase subunit B